MKLDQSIEVYADEEGKLLAIVHLVLVVVEGLPERFTIEFLHEVRKFEQGI